MKVFRNKLTMRLGETQFSEDAEVLKVNARAAGILETEIEIIDMTPEAYDAAIKIQNQADNPDTSKQDYAALTTDSLRIDYIAQKLGLK